MSGATGRGSAKTKKVDKDIELVKIHVFSERAHTRYTTIVTTSYAIFVGFVVVFYTLFFENVLTLDIFLISVIILTVGAIYDCIVSAEPIERLSKKLLT